MDNYTDYGNYLDKIHFNELAAKDPKEVVSRTLCHYDSHDRAYEVSVFDSKFRIYPNEMRIEQNKNEKHPHPFLELFMVHYLLSVKHIETQNEWISEKDMPGGPTFFRGPHAIPAKLISKRFGNDIKGFKEHCLRLKGRELNLADSSYAFDITQGIPVAVLLWAGDEEFDAEAKLLFDKSITDHFALDIIFALAVGVCEKIAN